MAKKMTMADKVREHTKANPKASAKEIAEALGTKIQYVHTVWYLDRKAKKPAVKRKVGRPAKVQPKAVTLDMIHEATIGLQQARSETLEKEVENLRAVIRYLEGKVYGASVRG